MSTALPNLFILGAAKAGTTTLFRVLSQHPQVAFPFLKEPMFFSHDPFYEHGTLWYQQTFFEALRDVPVRGDASPHYLYWADKVAARIAQVADEQTKFVAILRDPVERAYSWYWNMVSEGLEDQPFETALEKEETRLKQHWDELQSLGRMTYGYRRGSSYGAQIAAFLKAFPRRQFYFLLTEDLRDLSGAAFQGLVAFLGLEAGFAFEAQLSNPASQPRNQSLHQALNQPSRIKELAKKLVPMRLRTALKSGVNRMNSSALDYPPMQAETREALRAQFRPGLIELEAMIERDLSAWYGEPA